MSKMENVLFFVQLERRRANKKRFNIQHNFLDDLDLEVNQTTVKAKYEDYFGHTNHEDYKMLSKIADNVSLFSIDERIIHSLLKSYQ